jgi:hypothetical protein
MLALCTCNHAEQDRHVRPCEQMKLKTTSLSLNQPIEHNGACVRLRGPLVGLFQVLLHWLLQKPCQTPNKKTASKLKP